jgi:hypothetical protein
MLRWLLLCENSFMIQCLVFGLLFTTAPKIQGSVNVLENEVILIIRHSEKPDTGDGLTEAGERRAKAYVEFFKAHKVDGKPLHLDYIFAAKDSKKSHLPRLTVEPLAEALKMKLDLRFTDKDPAAMAKELMTHRFGHEILLSWRHGEIPALIGALGGDAKPLVPETKWPDSVFDRVIELHFDANGKFSSSQSKMIKEHLMPGDED